MDDHDEQPVPRVRGDHDGAGDARRHRQAAHRHPGHRRRLRQQDHVPPAARRVLPARAEAQPADPVDGVADGLPPVDVARERALVPRHGGRGQGRRHDARLPHEGDRRRGGVPPLRAARRRHLGAGLAGDVPLAQHPRRVHAGDDEQGARLAEPRLLADAAPVADGADHRHRRRRARHGPGRDPEGELRPARGHAVRDAERLRLRLGRLPARARHGARDDRLRHDRGAAGGGSLAREAARRRDRLDARLRDEQLRPVAAPQPRPAVLGEQRGRDGRSSTSSARSSSRSGRRRRGRVTRRRPRRSSRTSSAATSTSSTSGPGTTATGTRTPASPGRTRASSRSRASAR